MASEEATVGTEQETKTPVIVPESNWLEYQGHVVCVQLRDDYAAVTAPGMFVRGPDGFALMSVLRGVLGVKLDQRGGQRLTLEMADPDPQKNTHVRVEFAPEQVLYLTVTQEEARIVAP